MDTAVDTARPVTGVRTLRRRFLGLGLLTLALVVGSGLFAAHAIEIGRRQLSAVEDLRVLESASERMLRDAERYRQHAPRDYPDYWRDTTLYYRQLRDDVAEIGRALERFDARTRQTPSLLGEVLAGARAQRAAAAERALLQAWTAFEVRLHERLGPDPDEPRLEWAAIHIVEAIDRVRAPLAALAADTAGLVDAQLDGVSRAGVVWLPLLFATVFVVLARALWTLYRRMRASIDGCHRIARGQFGHELAVDSDDELGLLAASINTLSRRVSALLGAIAGTQSGRDLDETLSGARAALRAIAPVDWIGLYDCSAEGGCELVAASPAGRTDPRRLRAGDPIALADPPTTLALAAAAELREGLAVAGLRSLLPVRLQRAGEGDQVLVFASRLAAAFGPDEQALLQSVAPLIGHGIDRSLLTERLLLATVEGLAALAESRDPETGDHLVRMARYSRILAEQLLADGTLDADRLDPRRIDLIERFAPMHDIGKVGVADAILRKPGPLSEEERATMQMHTLIGGAVLRACRAQLPERHREPFDLAIEIAEGHHERWGGGGYPRGLAGAAIPLAARIVAVADVLDALSTRRPYKDAWPLADALAHIEHHAGSHFDPAVVGAARAAQARIAEVHARFAGGTSASTAA